MATDTNIEWTDHTWNPWKGCHHVDAGCQNCYARREILTYGGRPDVVTRCKTTWTQPTAKSRAGEYKWPDGHRVFSCSWSDFFHPDADPWRPEAWDIIHSRPGLTFQLLTKRPERIEQCLPTDWGSGYDNVWLGFSSDSDARYHARWHIMKNIPAACTFVSLEPLLAPVGILDYKTHGNYPDWIITGGETGPNARAPRPEWFRNLRDQCESLALPFFFKRWGTCCPPDQNMFRLDGIQYHQFPKTTPTQEPTP
jgi:protein gp37